jgi:hypothetical protein
VQDFINPFETFELTPQLAVFGLYRLGLFLDLLYTRLIPGISATRLHNYDSRVRDAWPKDACIF